MAVTAQTILEQLEDAISKLSTGTNATVNFNGQSFTKKNIDELIKARTYWKAEVLRSQPRLPFAGRSVVFFRD